MAVSAKDPIKDSMSDPNQLLNYFSPDINRGFDESVVHNFGQLFKNVGSIIATEARRALAFIQHPVKTGFLTNRKILARLEEINVNHHRIIEKSIVAFEKQINTSNTKYKDGYRKHDIIERINHLKTKVEVRPQERPQAKPLRVSTTPPTQPLWTYVQTAHDTARFLGRDTDTSRETPPVSAEPAPSEPVAERDRTVGRPNVDFERVAYNRIASDREEFRLIASSLRRLVRSEEFQQIFANIKPGHYEVSFNELGDTVKLFAHLKDLPFLKNLALIIDKTNRGVIASIAEQAGRKRLGAPVAFDPEAQNPVNEAIEEMLMEVIYEPLALRQERAPVQGDQVRESKSIEPANFSRKAFKRLLQNIDALVREENVHHVLSGLKPGKYKVTLDDNRIQKLVEGLSRNEKALLVPQLKVWDFFVEKNKGGVFLSVGEKGGGKRLGAPAALDPETQQLLANSLSDAFQRGLSDTNNRSIGNFNAALDQAESLLKRNEGRRERLLEALNRDDVTPQKVKEIRRELIELRKQIEASLNALEAAYKGAKGYLSENDKSVRNTYAWTLATLSRQLYHDLHPEPFIGPNEQLRELHRERKARASQPRQLPSVIRGSDDLGDQSVRSNEQLKGLRGEREERASFEKLLKETATALTGFKERKDQLLSEGKTAQTVGALSDLEGEVLDSHLELFSSHFKLGRDRSSQQLNSRVEEILTELKNLYIELFKVIENASEPRPNVVNLEETKKETFPVEPRPVEEFPRQDRGLRPGARPLLMLAMMMAAMFFAGKSVLEGQQVSDGVSIRTPDGFAPVPVEDFKFEPQSFIWSEEPVRGQMGMLYDVLDKGTPQESVNAALELANMYEPKSKDRIYYLSEIFGSSEKVTYILYGVLWNSEVRNDPGVKQIIEPYLNGALEILATDGMPETIRAEAKYLMNAIGKEGFFQKEILNSPIEETYDLLSYVLTMPFNPTKPLPDIEAAIDVAKREIPKGNDSHLARHLKALNLIVGDDPIAEEHLRQANVNHIARRLLCNFDVFLMYPQIFDNPHFVRQMMKMIENDAIKLKTASSNIDPFDLPIKGVFNVVSYGVLAHPEDKEPQRLLFEFWKRGVLHDTIVAIPSPAVYAYLKNGLEARLPAAIEIAQREIARGESSYLAGMQRTELEEYIRMHPDIA